MLSVAVMRSSRVGGCAGSFGFGSMIRAHALAIASIPTSPSTRNRIAFMRAPFDRPPVRRDRLASRATPSLPETAHGATGAAQCRDIGGVYKRRTAQRQENTGKRETAGSAVEQTGQQCAAGIAATLV